MSDPFVTPDPAPPEMDPAGAPEESPPDVAPTPDSDPMDRPVDGVGDGSVLAAGGWASLA